MRPAVANTKDGKIGTPLGPELPLFLQCDLR